MNSVGSKQWNRKSRTRGFAGRGRGPTSAGVVIGVTFLSALAGGCLERKETIRITPQGGAHIELEYSGEPQQFETVDALPSGEGGWSVTRSTTREDDGKEKVTLVAEGQFEPREELPSNYAVKGDPDADLFLQFPTSLQIERRPDGTYLHFRRAYQPREWAYVQFWQDQFVDDDIKKRAEKPVEEMSPEDRVRIVRAFAGFEFFKQLEHFQAAMRRMDPRVPQDLWLAARHRVVEKLETTNWESIVSSLVALPEDQRDQEFEAASRRLLDENYVTFIEEMGRRGVNEEQVRRIEAAFARFEKQYQITAETGGHAFHIRVNMPGEVVAHNADKIDDDGAAVWEFGGDAFRDRPYELLITSRLPRN